MAMPPSLAPTFLQLDLSGLFTVEMQKRLIVEEFKEFLVSPIPIKLNDREIRDEWRTK